jgi:hypothetical protein
MSDDGGAEVESSALDLTRLGLYSMWATTEAALVALGHPSVGVAVSAAGPFALRAVDRFVRASHDRRRERSALCLAVTSHKLGASIDDVLARLDDPARGLLAELALEASATTATLEKVLALGSALADGVEADQDRLDEITMIVRALDDLEIPHIRVLNSLAGGPRTLGHPRGVPGFKPSAVQSMMGIDVRAQSFTRREIESGFPEYGVALDGVLAVLLRHGLIVEKPGDLAHEMQQQQRLNALGGRGNPGGIPSGVRQPPTQYQLTGLGLATLEYVWAASESGDSPTQQPGPD